MTAKKKAPAKKAPAKKAAAKPAAKAPEAPEPMDSSVPEVTGAPPVANRQRNAYALDVLIGEVLEVFPETTFEVSGVNRFNTALHVAFHPEEFERLDELLALVEDDPRVEEVLAEPEDHTILVCLHANLRLQDSRELFGLSEAWVILAEKYGDAR